VARRLRAADGRRLSRPRLPNLGPAGSAGPGGWIAEELPKLEPFGRSFFEQPVTEVARELLGACLVSTIGGERAVLTIVETEAYGGADDPASHAAVRAGVTQRNRAMFGSAGHAYVYRSYGVHWCLNVVTGAEGEGQAVLLRGALPVEGEPVMRARRSGRTPLGAGPGRLAQALGVTGAFYGHDLSLEPLVLATGWRVEGSRVGVSERIGITAGAERPYRFYVRGAHGVSGRPR
jgi:DNA-3-methyladenine glycosylase